MPLHILETTDSDFEALVELRIEAMREGLERIGRFDRERSSERFRSTFVAEETKRIFCDDVLVGFYALTHKEEHLFLGHLYVKPEYQSRGVGSLALQRVIEQSNQVGLPIRLGALKASRSNDFYQKHGFAVTCEDKWDIYYERPVGKD